MEELDKSAINSQSQSSIFQCKISSQSYPYIEVFYNCYAPPVRPVSPHSLTSNQQNGTQPVVILYQNVGAPQPPQRSVRAFCSHNTLIAIVRKRAYSHHFFFDLLEMYRVSAIKLHTLNVNKI